MNSFAFLLPLSILLSTPSGTTPQTRPLGQPTARTEVDDQNWEYIVVTFDKSTFSLLSDAKPSNLNKTFAYAPAGFKPWRKPTDGFQFGREAVTKQSQMDVLGKFGWELITAIGTTEGDQELVFKRRFDPTRGAREAKMIDEESKVREANQKATAIEPALIDEDDSEQIKKCLEIQTGWQTNYTSYATKALTGGAKLKGVTVTYTSHGGGLSHSSAPSMIVTITIDGTVPLLKDGGKYRGSEAKKFIDDVKSAVTSFAGLKSGTDTEINFEVVVGFNGKDVRVGYAYDVVNALG